MSAQKTILMVDDDRDFVESNKDLAEAHGYRVLLAYDGESGLALAKQEQPDLMLLDVMMASDTEGFEISRRIPESPELQGMPVILITGIRQEKQLTYSFEPHESWLPVNKVLEKPVDPEVLMAEIRKAIGA